MKIFTSIQKRPLVLRSVSLLLAGLMLSSCSSRIASVKIQSDKPVNEPITMTVYGQKDTKVEKINRLPVSLRLEYKNLPATITFKSDFHNFSEVNVTKNYKGSRSSKFWRRGGNTLITLGTIAAAVGALGYIDIRDEEEKLNDEEKKQMIPSNVNRILLYGGGGGVVLGTVFRLIGTARDNATLYSVNSNTHVTHVTDNLKRFDIYAKNYVTERFNNWKQKSEFESTEQYRQRVNPTSIKEYQAKLLADAVDQFIEDNRPGDRISYTLGTYDADNQSFLVKTNYGDLIVPVAASYAEEFKRNFINGVVKSPKFGVNKTDIVVTECGFRDQSGRTYVADVNEVAAYNVFNERNSDKVTKVDLDLASVTAKDNRNKVTAKQYAVAGTDEIDKNIPQTKEKNDNVYVVIIGNENYGENYEVVDVPFANNDANIFRQYCEKTLGIPAENIKFHVNATGNNMIDAVDWLKTIVKTKGASNAKTIFYYAGHGIPDLVNNSAYLLPVDGNPSNLIRTGFSLKNDLYDNLASIGAKESIVLLDACFSGVATKDGARAVGQHVAPQEKPNQGNLVVFSAATDKQTSNAYSEKSHGVFTYFLLKKLHDSKGNASLGEIFDYLHQEVNSTSFTKLHKEQKPTFQVSDPIKYTWRDIKLK